MGGFKAHGLGRFQDTAPEFRLEGYVTDVHFAVEQGLGFLGFRAQGLGVRVDLVAYSVLALGIVKVRSIPHVGGQGGSIGPYLLRPTIP